MYRTDQVNEKSAKSQSCTRYFNEFLQLAWNRAKISSLIL